MGKRARETVENAWSWDLQAQNYVPFFDYGLEILNADALKNKAKRFV